ncbi:unnamed protein product [Closterium sp. Yama58-4]|nr:unnamed protein product [Closterium sp. Yama58-4]
MAHDIRNLAVAPAAALLLVAAHLISTAAAFRFQPPEPLSGVVRINCRSSDPVIINGRQWRADAFYESGHPVRIPPSPPFSSAPLASPVEATLRAFPEGNSNGGCYTVPLPADARYLVRVGVAYRNYDGARRPPAFHMAVNGVILRSVVMGVTEQQFPLSAFYSEFVTFAHHGRIAVCFLPLLGVVAAPPQVNSLELLPAHPLAYDGAVTGRDVVVVPLLRHNLGAAGVAGGGVGGGVRALQQDSGKASGVGRVSGGSTVGGTVGRVAELEGEEAEAADEGGVEGRRGQVGRAGELAEGGRGLLEEKGEGRHGGMVEVGWAEEDRAFRVWGRDLAPAWGAVPGSVAVQSGASSDASGGGSSSVEANSTTADNWVTVGIRSKWSPPPEALLVLTWRRTSFHPQCSSRRGREQWRRGRARGESE